MTLAIQLQPPFAVDLVFALGAVLFGANLLSRAPNTDQTLVSKLQAQAWEYMPLPGRDADTLDKPWRVAPSQGRETAAMAVRRPIPPQGACCGA
jgi:hypothetical protein